MSCEAAACYHNRDVGARTTGGQEAQDVANVNRIGQITLPGATDAVTITRMTAVERISEPFTIVVDIEHLGTAGLNLHPILAHNVTIKFDSARGFVEGPDPISRYFSGILWEYVELGKTTDEKGFTYRLTLRPTLELRTIERQSIIHYKKTISDLIGGFPNFNITTKITDSYAAVEYRVQYDESSFAFLSRHLEKEGIYYFYRHSESGHECLMLDARNSHPAMVPATVKLDPQGTSPGILFSLVERRSFAPTKYTVDDYDYTVPTQDLHKDAKAETFGAPPKRFVNGGEVAQKGLPRYVYPGNYDAATLDAGQRYANVWLDRDRRLMARSFAEGNFFAAAVGRTLTVDFSMTDTENADTEYLIVGTTHRYTGGSSNRSGEQGGEEFHVELELMPAALQYRPAAMTPIPRIYGPQTGVVIGPSGEEIYTDKYGRVKVQFFWDKIEPVDQSQSLWCRVGQFSAGPGYGAFMVPRIGNEVIVEFLNGDPDRPIITGSVYNGTNLPDTSFGTAADNTVQGWRTNSSKGGGGYNEIKIDDKKGSELFSLHAQKDLKWVVDKGDETRDLLHGSRTTTIHEGDETMTVTKGKRTTTIKGDETTTIQSGSVTHEVTEGDVTRTVKAGKRTTTIEGNDEKTIKTGDHLTTVKMGDHKTTVSMGDREATVSMGNEKLTVSMGDVTIKVSLGNHKTEALQSIELKCGASTIKMDPMSIEMKSMMVKIEGELMLETKGLLVQQEASALHIIKGGLVMIN